MSKSNQRIRVVLKAERERALRRHHPWIFSGAIGRIEGQPEAGALVDVVSARGEFLACGHYYDQSLAVRICAFAPIQDENEHWRGRIGAAVKLRRELGLVANAETSMFRLVNGEGDGFPGLMVDVYGDTAVLQCHTPGMFRSRQFIAEVVRAELNLSGVYDKSAEALSRTYPDFVRGEKLQNGILCGVAGEGFALEHGSRFRIDWSGGQKTGFFLDQRENRKFVSELAAGRSVLNCFSYTGGFSVAAARGGASRVVSVDSSAPALALAAEHVSANAPGVSHETVCADCRDFLADCREQFSCVILDPPPFARSQKAAAAALNAYRELNELGMRCVAPGGLLLTFSCSQPVSGDDFHEAALRAAQNTGRSARILRRLGAGLDHPVSLFHPEGEYLKGFALVLD